MKTHMCRRRFAATSASWSPAISPAKPASSARRVNSTMRDSIGPAKMPLDSGSNRSV